MISELTLQADCEGVPIRGLAYRTRKADRLPLLIILHGIPRAKPVESDSSYRDMARSFAEDGFLAVTMNFRGTGISGGDMSMAGWVKDLKAMMERARTVEAADPDRLALLGFSAGGSVAIRAAAEDPRVSAVVSASSPAQYDFLQTTMPASGWVRLFREIGLIRTPGFPPSISEWEAEFREMEPVNWVGKLSPRPVLIMHGEDDETIPPEHARKLYQLAGEPKDLVMIPGGAHRLRVDPRAVAEARKWLLKWKDGPGKS